MLEVLKDSLLDTLILLPFLLLLYILIELLEHATRVGKPNRALSGKFAPLLGSCTGLVPMCGFSVMASKLYERKFLTLGTLLAVFIATSDEALIVLLLSGMAWGSKLLTVLALCGVKLVIGAGVGYLLDYILKKKRGTAFTLVPFEEGHDHEENEPHACEHKHESKLTLYLLSPLMHALQVAAVIFLFNVAFGALFYAVGQDNVLGFLQGAGLWYQPLVACFIGMIPNCASSVVLAEVYAFGGIAFGSLLGGLITNAGLGVLVLFRNLKAWKRNLIILLATYLLGVVFGYAVNLIALFI